MLATTVHQQIVERPVFYTEAGMGYRAEFVEEFKRFKVTFVPDNVKQMTGHILANVCMFQGDYLNRSNQIGRDELKRALVSQRFEWSKKVRFSKNPVDVFPCGFTIMHHTIRVVMSACVIQSLCAVRSCGHRLGCLHLDCGQRLCIRMIDYATFTTSLPLPGGVY